MALQSESGRTVYPKIGIWHADDGHIRMSIEGQGLTSVTNDPASERYHRTLYEKLAEVLRLAGRMPPPSSAGSP